MKNVLYALGFCCLLLSSYLLYDWYISDINNREAKYSIGSFATTFILFIIAWRYEPVSKDEAIATNILSGGNENETVGQNKKAKQWNFLSFKNKNSSK